MNEEWKDMTPDQFFEEMHKRVEAKPDVIKGLQGETFVYDFTSSGDGIWSYEFIDDFFTIEKKSIPNPKVTISCKFALMKDIAFGKTNGNVAMMTGKLKFKGSMTSALKLGKIM